MDDGYLLKTLYFENKSNFFYFASLLPKGHGNGGIKSLI